MKRVVVLGAGGAGKTRLANELSRRTGLPVVHLDRIFWGPGWTARPAEEAQPELAEAVAAGRPAGRLLREPQPAVPPLDLALPPQ